MVKWGFSRNEIKDMPIQEFEEYERMLSEYYEKRNALSSSVKSGGQEAPKQPPTNPYGTIK